MGASVLIKNVTICFPHLYEKHAAPGTQNTPKYGAELIIDPASQATELQKLQNAFTQALTDAGKASRAQYIQPPWKDGNTVNQERLAQGKDPRQELENKVMLRASSHSAPGVADRMGQPMNEEIGKPAIFGGCVVNAHVDLYWHETGARSGIFCGLNGIQLVDNVNVTRLGGGAPTVEEMFGPIEGAPEPLVPPTTGGTPPAWM